MAPPRRDIAGLLREHGYNEIRKVGEGSFGMAVLVEQQSDKSRLICKIVDLSNASIKEQRDAVRECKLLAAFRHPYVVRYKESFLDETSWYLGIIMDYCEGGDLSSRIEQQRTRRPIRGFQEDQILRWCTQALLGLKFLHEKHLLHRDIKSQNLFLTKGGNLKIGDFGIAKVLSSTVACAKTQIGTPYYLSPELCEEKPYSFASDIWAMGVVLYELCALRMPFDAPNFLALVNRVCHGTPPALSNSYSKDVRQLCSDMLARKPERRPTANEILQRPVVQCVIKQLLEEKITGDANGGGGGSSSSRAGVDNVVECPKQIVHASCVPVEERANQVRRLLEQLPDQVAHRVQAPSPRPQAVPKCPSPVSGNFRTGDRVEYWSDTHGEWLPAVVLETNEDGSIRIDLKPSSWLSRGLQATKVRMASPNNTPGRVQRSNSLGVVPLPAGRESPVSRHRADTPGSKRCPSPSIAISEVATPLRRRVESPSPVLRPPGLPCGTPNRRGPAAAGQPGTPGQRPGMVCRNAGLAIVSPSNGSHE